MRYRADITAGSLKVPESRVVADLLLRGVSAQAWGDAVRKQNLLQTRNPATAVRVGRLIRKRLELMDADLWRLVRDEKDLLNPQPGGPRARHPSRDAVIRLGLALRLGIEEMDELLLAAGYAPLVR